MTSANATRANVAGSAASGHEYVFGTAIGADYRLSPFTLAGFALAGGGTSFNAVERCEPVVLLGIIGIAPRDAQAAAMVIRPLQAFRVEGDWPVQASRYVGSMETGIDVSNRRLSFTGL